MSLNDPIGQHLPESAAEQVPSGRVEQTIKALNENRLAVQRWFWKGLLAFNLMLASLVFWLRIIPSLL